MSGNDPLEKRLQRQPPRNVPPAWRDEILSATRVATQEPRLSKPAHRGALSLLSALFWPHPKAWAGLASLWVVIIGLHLASRDVPQNDVAQRTLAPSPQMRDLLRQQEQLFAELIGPRVPMQADRKKIAPHSRRREEFFAA